ncbi:MAG: 2-hydroxyacyl-CoA dehydratase family protein [Dehalococcoidia bacterium]|nr:2-hydroxyacyl-CoA dehydratase family protein [Dehalococcoidia bacterium]
MKERLARALAAQAAGAGWAAWHWAVSPAEILRAFGIYTFMVEYHAGYLAAIGEIVPYLEEAEARGFPRDVCSLHKAVLGHSLLGVKAHIPDPDFLLAATSCDSTAKALFALADHFSAPYYLIDIPQNVLVGDGSGVEEFRVKYYTAQFEELIARLEALTGRPLSDSDLAGTIARAARAYELWGEINQLRRTVPCPMGGTDDTAAIGVLMNLPGTPEAIIYMERLRDEVADRVRAGQGVIPDERHRLLWLGPSVMYDMGLFNFFEDLGAVVVKCELDYLYSGLFAGRLDPANPLESLARKQIAHPYSGISENRVNGVRRMVEEFQADGVIFYCSWFCRLLGGNQRAIKEAISADFGVPLLVIDGDGVDPRSYSVEQVHNKIEDFIDMLG